MLIAYNLDQEDVKAFGGDLFDVGGGRSRPLYNAENLTFTSGGRLFATGSAGLFEIMLDPTQSEAGGHGSAIKARWRPVPVDAPLVRGPFMTNGIATDGQWLYVACAAIDQSANPLTTLWPPITQIEQTALGAFCLYSALKICPVRSWIVRAKLSEKPLVFEEAMPLEEDCFANGIEVDASRKRLFVACGGKKIAQVRLDGDRMAEGQILVMPGMEGGSNGVKVHDSDLFFTANNWLTVPSTTYVYRLQPPDLPVSAKPAPRHEVQADLVQRRHAFFDDFDQVARGFVVTAVTDYVTLADWLPPTSGSIRFIDERGVNLGYYRHPLLRHPSAVRVVRDEEVPGTRPGDMFITEKHAHTLYLLRPEPALREWLIG